MKTSKIIIRATELKAKGYKNIASVVKSHFDTTYYHVVSIDAVIAAGKWIPAGKVQFASGAYGRVGTSGKNIDWTITARR